MKSPNREEQRRLVRQWEETSRELECIRREALKGMPYNWVNVDALLKLGAASIPTERRESGLVEMQRYFIRAAPH